MSIPSFSDWFGSNIGVKYEDQIQDHMKLVQDRLTQEGKKQLEIASIQYPIKLAEYAEKNIKDVLTKYRNVSTAQIQDIINHISVELVINY
jgi:hypothetical protein